MFRDAMPNGFAWEVTDVYSGCARLLQHLQTEYLLADASADRQARQWVSWL